LKRDFLKQNSIIRLKTYISILRGINVSGHRMIKMDALKKMYLDLGLVNVHSYIQSGNVMFQFNKSDSAKLENTIKAAIFKEFGFDVPVLVKDADEMQNVLKNNPFIKKKDVDLTKLHVTLLSELPGQTDLSKLKEYSFLPDEFMVSDKIIYLYCPNGYGNTKLNNNFFENKLKVTATTRNWKTINELVKIAKSLTE
jgi:uncharacterized protein (DUF1697 family)